MDSAPVVEVRERVLYHQIHPLKLAVDVSGSLASTILLWKHSLLVGIVVTLLPSIAVSAAMLRWTDLRRQRTSAFGRYVAFHMTRVAEAVRFGGQIVVWVGAWAHSGPAVAGGIATIVFGWTYSLPRWLSRGAGAGSEPMAGRE